MRTDLRKTLFIEAMNLAREGKTDRAAACFEAIPGQPGNSVAYNLALCYLKLGRMDESAKLLRSLMEEHPGDPDVLVNIGKLLWRGGRANQALAFFQKALKIAPEHPEALCRVGIIFGKTFGKYKEAIFCLEKAAEIHDRLPEAHQALGICYHHGGDMEKAIQHLKLAVEMDPDNAAVHNHLGIMYMRIGNDDWADRHFRRAVELNPEIKLRHQNLWEMDI